jgi:hypothetical protein
MPASVEQLTSPSNGWISGRAPPRSARSSKRIERSPRLKQRVCSSRARLPAQLGEPPCGAPRRRPWGYRLPELIAPHPARKGEAPSFYDGLGILPHTALPNGAAVTTRGRATAAGQDQLIAVYLPSCGLCLQRSLVAVRRPSATTGPSAIDDCRCRETCLFSKFCEVPSSSGMTCV